MRSSISVSQNIRPILASIQTVPVAGRPIGAPEPSPPAAPFITVSRQPGAGAWKVAQEFVDAMNAADPDGPRWTWWDRELVEKVSADHHLSERLIESLDEGDHSWITDLFAGFSASEHHDDVAIYHRVVKTIRALAQAGHVLLIGRGSVFATANMDGGIHLRLVAPRKDRVRNIARSMEKSQADAEAWIAQQEKNRAAFYKRFWPGKTLDPEAFTLTINTSSVNGAEMIALLAALVKERAAQRLTAR